MHVLMMLHAKFHPHINIFLGMENIITKKKGIMQPRVSIRSNVKNLLAWSRQIDHYHSLG